MTEGFRAESPAVTAHAAELEALAERAARAAAIAQPLRSDAYGLVGQAFAGMADDAGRTGSRAVAELAEALRQQADGVRAHLEAYAATDAAVAGVLRGIR